MFVVIYFFFFRLMFAFLFLSDVWTEIVFQTYKFLTLWSEIIKLQSVAWKFIQF